MELIDIILVLLVLIFIYFLYTLQNNINQTNTTIIQSENQSEIQSEIQSENQSEIQSENNKHKPIMWVYWELVNGATDPPAYINLCLDIMKRNASNTFNIKFLNEKTVFNYLPDLRSDINSLPIALKTDYIRVRLLTKYGGLWIDADTIIMTDLRELVQQLNQGID